MKKSHGERKHSKFSASGAERWTNCSGAPALEEGKPDKSSDAALRGTLAHEVLEAIMKGARLPRAATTEMLAAARQAVFFIRKLATPLAPYVEVVSEMRVHLDFIHPEMFGTFDGAVIEQFGELHIFDYKYGVKYVSPKDNLQMIFYAIGLAHLHHWNFQKVRLWIIQPNHKGFKGPTFHDMTIDELKAYVPFFKKAVKRVETHPKDYKEGPWCFFCKGKTECPLKNEVRAQKIRSKFTPIT